MAIQQFYPPKTFIPTQNKFLATPLLYTLARLHGLQLLASFLGTFLRDELTQTTCEWRADKHSDNNERRGGLEWDQVIELAMCGLVLCTVSRVMSLWDGMVPWPGRTRAHFGMCIWRQRRRKIVIMDYRSDGSPTYFMRTFARVSLNGVQFQKVAVNQRSQFPPGPGVLPRQLLSSIGPSHHWTRPSFSNIL